MRLFFKRVTNWQHSHLTSTGVAIRRPVQGSPDPVGLGQVEEVVLLSLHWPFAATVCPMPLILD